MEDTAYGQDSVYTFLSEQTESQFLQVLLNYSKAPSFLAISVGSSVSRDWLLLDAVLGRENILGF